MKSTLFLIAIAIATLTTTSCASTSKASESKNSEALTFEAPADRGSVFLYRTGRMVGAAGQLQVRVNSQAAGGTGPGTFFRWDLKPGTYTLSSSTGESSAVVQIEVKAGELYFVRQDARMGIESGRVTMKEVDDKQGKSEVSNCKLLVSSYVPE
jgi:hypothetical protein